MDYKDLEDYIQKMMTSTFDKIYLIQDGMSYCEVPTDNSSNPSSLKVNNDLPSLFTNYKENVLDIINNNEQAKVLITTKDNNNAVLNVNAIGKFKCVSIINLDQKPILNKNKKTVLVADDSKMITNFLIKAIGDDYNVLTAGDGNEVIDIVNNNKLDGIFLDLEMPSKNGYEVLEYFNTLDIFSRIPVAVISGEDSKDGIEKTANYPIVDILQKPFSIEVAKAFIDKVINIKNEDDNR